MASVADIWITSRKQWRNESDREKVLREKPVPATLSTTNPTRTDLGSNPDLHGDQLLSYGMAIMYRLCSMILLQQKSIKPLLG